MTDGSSTTSLDCLVAEWRTGDPSSSSKMSPTCSPQLVKVGTLWDELFDDWPRSGTASTGGVYRRPQLEHPIDGTDGGDSRTLPTPTTVDSFAGTRNDFSLASSDHTLREVAEWLGGHMSERSSDGSPL